MNNHSLSKSRVSSPSVISLSYIYRPRPAAYNILYLVEVLKCFQNTEEEIDWLGVCVSWNIPDNHIYIYIFILMINPDNLFITNLLVWTDIYIYIYLMGITHVILYICTHVIIIMIIITRAVYKRWVNARTLKPRMCLWLINVWL